MITDLVFNAGIAAIFAALAVASWLTNRHFTKDLPVWTEATS